VYKTITESDERISRDDNLATTVEIRKLHEGGRKNGDTNLTPLMRTLIGAAAEVDQNNAKTAKTFDVSDRAVANYRKGRTSHSTAVVPAARAEVEEVVETAKDQKQDIKSKATSRLDSLFDGPISQENLATLKPREAISAAKDLATVIDRVSVRQPGDDKRVQVVIFSPRQREEKEYEVIDVSSRDVS
jgi:hypothetical protein